MDFKNRFLKAYAQIKKAKRVLVVSHVSPDGDALSSVGATLELLKILDIKCVAFSGGRRTSTFNYLPHSDRILQDEKEIGDLEQFDLIITLDCGSLSRTGLSTEIKKVKEVKPEIYIIEFDHHPKMDDYADLEIRDPEKAATVEIVYNFLKENKVAINKNMANCILTGILTDTGNFLYPNASDENLEIASKMMALGAQFPKIINSTLRNQNIFTMRLWGMAMDNLRINKKYNIAYSVITDEDIEKLGPKEETQQYLESDIFGDIAGFLGNLSEVQAIMFLRQDGERIKGSLRTSRPDMDISGLAQHLGGGGHPKASGFSVEGKIVKKGDSWEIV